MDCSLMIYPSCPMNLESQKSRTDAETVMDYHHSPSMVSNFELGGGFKYFFFHPGPWGNDPI